MAKKFVNYTFNYLSEKKIKGERCVTYATVTYYGEVRTCNPKGHEARYNIDLLAVNYGGVDILPFLNTEDTIQPIVEAALKHLEQTECYPVDPEPKPSRYYEPLTVAPHYIHF